MTPTERDAADAPHPVDDAFLLALVLGLRARGAQAGLSDLFACRRIVRCQEDWTPKALRSALKAVLVRRLRDASAFDALIEDLLAAPEPEHTLSPPVVVPTFTGEPPPKPPPRWWRLAAQRFQGFGSHAVKHLAALWRTSAFARASAERLAAYPMRSLVLVAAAGLAAIGAATWGGSVSENSSRVEGPAQLSSVLIALAIASTVTFLTVLIWRGATMARHAKGSCRPTEPPPLLTPDDSVFRLGWVGGPPPRFLSPAVAAEIADMFTYRPGEVDTDEINVAGTILAQVRSANRATLVFAIRRELPTILLAVDSAARAVLWNSLAEEFEEALVRRGVNHQRFDFDGSFFAGRRGAERGRRAVAAIEDEIGAPGWTVTVILGEARRLADADFGLLSRAAENGPVLFLEMTDPALWGRWQERLRLTGLDVEPATALGLKDGLARVFAPDRATSEPTRQRRAPPAAWADQRTLVERQLGPVLADWAAACALLQPVSFALAERLRHSFEEIKSPQPDLAYSRLAALPGSWLGPEGLKFDPSLRANLLQRFATLPGERRSAALAIIRNSFAELRAEGYMEGVTADSLARFALASACVFAPDASEALDSISDLDRQGVVDSTMMRTFVARLALPDDTSRSAPDGIRLADTPSRAESARYLRHIRAEAGRAPSRPGRVAAARWSLGVPDIRIRSDDADAAAVAGATFFAGGRQLLMDRGPERRSSRLEINDLQSGTMVVLESALGDAPLTGLWSARDARAAVIAVRGQRPYLVRSPETADGGEATISELRLPGDNTFPGTDETFVTGLDTEGRRVAFTIPGQRGVVVFNTQSGQYSDAIQCDGEVTAIHVDLSGRVSVGLRDGTLRVVQPAADENFGTGRTIVTLDSHVSALALLKPEDPDGLLVVANDGVIRLIEGGRLSNGATDPAYARVIGEYNMNGRPNRLAILTDRPAARVNGITTGVCVAILGPGGAFDIVGLLLPPDEAASAQDTRPSEDKRPLLAPIPLLDRAVSASDPSRRVLALHAPGRRVAILAHKRIEIRPLLYALPEDEAEAGDDVQAYEPSESPA